MEVLDILTVTESAKLELKRMLLEYGDDPEIGLRLTVETSRQFGLVRGKEGAGDHVTEYEGSKVLLVAPELVTLLDEITIDTKDTPEGNRLTLSRG